MNIVPRKLSNEDVFSDLTPLPFVVELLTTALNTSILPLIPEDTHIASPLFRPCSQDEPVIKKQKQWESDRSIDKGLLDNIKVSSDFNTTPEKISYEENINNETTKFVNNGITSNIN